MWLSMPQSMSKPSYGGVKGKVCVGEKAAKEYREGCGGR
jgi:hypothetical protein